MATRFWVGGTGTWDASSTTHWASTSGGSGGASAPTTGDNPTFDGSSGTGTVTLDATLSGKSFGTLTADAMSGLTLDFSVNNPTLTFTGAFSSNGSTTRSINLGTSTINLAGSNITAWSFGTVTGLTATFQNATINIAPAAFTGTITFNSGGLTYGTLNISALFADSVTVNNGGTFGHLGLSGPLAVSFTSNFTISNSINWAGTSSSPIIVSGAAASATSITLNAAGNIASWVGFRGITAVTNTITASNSFDMKNNTNVTLTNPAVGSAAGVFGS